MQLVTATGVWVGMGEGQIADRDRLYRVAGRIVRGLHYHCLGVRVSAPCDVYVRHFIDLESSGHMTRSETDAFVLRARGLPGGTVGTADVFAYRYAVGPPFPLGESWWLLGFYGGADFVARVGEAGDPGSVFGSKHALADIVLPMEIHHRGEAEAEA